MAFLDVECEWNAALMLPAFARPRKLTTLFDAARAPKERRFDGAVITSAKTIRRAPPMTIVLNHTIVPAHDKAAAARWFAQIFGLQFEQSEDHFAPVQVNDTLTLLFADRDDSFQSSHYAFHVSDAEFDAILGRVQDERCAFGSSPWSRDDGQLNDWNGGRGVYFESPDGHILELMTVAQ